MPSGITGESGAAAEPLGSAPSIRDEREAVRDLVFGDENDPDRALRFAIKDAIDRGQLDRAAKLLDVLRATAPAPVIDALRAWRARAA